jgi:hypothetical protein
VKLGTSPRIASQLMVLLLIGCWHLKFP